MAILIDNKALEDALTRLSTQQAFRVSKTRMALSILERALELCEQTGNPEAWRNFNGGALIRASTDSARPDGSVLDTASDEAGPSIPPASQEATQSGSPDDAIEAV